MDSYLRSSSIEQKRAGRASTVLVTAVIRRVRTVLIVMRRFFSWLRIGVEERAFLLRSLDLPISHVTTLRNREREKAES